jgi:hypothetical protein
MKKILMAAAAVTALTAGVANAATFDTTGTGSTVGTKSLALPASGAVGTTPEAYTIGNEVRLTDTSTINAVLKVNPSSGTAIGIGNYLVTFNVTGGTFDISSIATGNLTLTGGGTVSSTSTVNAGTISFIVNQATGNLTAMSFSVPIKTGTAKAPIAVSGSIQSTASLLPVDGGTIPSVTIVDYRDGLSFGATKADQTLTLASGFKKFSGGSGDVTAANIATAVGFTANTGVNNTDTVQTDLVGGALLTGEIQSAVLTVGGDLSAFNVKVGTQAADNTANPGVVTLTSLTNLKGQSETISLNQKSTPVVGVESAYTVTPVITLSTGLNPLTYAAAKIGTVSFEGNSFYAAWVGDGTNGISYSIRLGNRTSSAVASVKASLLNPAVTGTSGTVASTASCEVGPIPASGELVISSDTLKTCFGAFKRSDVKILFQSSVSSLTAKMRTVSAGMVTEAPLGGGSTVATQQ